MKHLPLVLGLALSLAGTPHAFQTAAPASAISERPGHWPAWRGPLGTGAAEADPPVHWSSTENVAWKVALPGQGKSTPIVWGERLFLLAAVPSRPATAEELAARPRFAELRTDAPDELMAFLALALDRRTGELLWETKLTERLPVTGVHSTNGHASFSPVTDGEGLYITLGSHGVHALDPATGEVRWTYELGPQHTRRGWGEAGSPALSGDTLLVLADQEGDSRLHALDTRTGRARWVVERDEPSTWTTPLVVDAGGAVQVVVNGTNAVRAYDLTSGEVLWSCGGQTLNAIPSPVSDGELVLCTSGFRGSACYALALDARGDLRSVEGGIAWSRSGGTPYVPSPLLVDGRVYLLAGYTGRLSCFELASGEVRLDRVHLELGNVYASPIAAAGRIYVTGRDGTTLVLRHGDELEVLARNELEDTIDATPVAVGGALYLRSDSTLYAIGRP